MESKKIDLKPTPSIVQSIANGFAMVSANLYLLILPILLDLLLWFGPRYRIYDMAVNSINQVYDQMMASVPQGMTLQFEQAFTALKDIIANLNLLGSLQSFPIGVSSLLAGNTPIAAPFEGIQIYELHSFGLILLLLLVCTLIGVFLGCFYYAIIANRTIEKPYHFTMGAWAKQTANIILFFIAIAAIACILLIPISCIATMITMTSPIIGQIVLIVLFLAVAWLIIPLFFTPHGIFLKNKSFIKAVSDSFVLSKWSAGPTSFFIVVAILISQGLNIIWTIPESDSWLLLIGIFGHAFISTGLIAASFFLYEKNLIWQQENSEFLKMYSLLKKTSQKNKG